QSHQRTLEPGDFPGKFDDLVAQPHPGIERHLAVAGAGGVQPSSRGHAAWQLLFEIHVDVFELRSPLKPAGGNLLANVIERFDDGSMFRLAEYPDALEHRRVGDGPEEIVPPQPPIERNGFSEPRDIRVGSAGKPPAA